MQKFFNQWLFQIPFIMSSSNAETNVDATKAVKNGTNGTASPTNGTNGATSSTNEKGKPRKESLKRVVFSLSEDPIDEDMISGQDPMSNEGESPVFTNQEEKAKGVDTKRSR